MHAFNQRTFKQCFLYRYALRPCRFTFITACRQQWWTLLTGLVLTVCVSVANAQDWPYYGGDAGGTRHSNAALINRENVAGLREVWRFSSGEYDPQDPATHWGAWEATPILVDNKLIFTSPFGRAFALDPVTGKELWRYDAKLASREYGELANRGASYWVDKEAGENDICARRIFFGTRDSRLISLDADNGQPCIDFGINGAVDLSRNVRLTAPLGEYAVTSPPVVFENLVITGSAVGDNRAVTVELGVVRALDARSGREVWRWDPIPRREDDPAHSQWREDQVDRNSAANAWAPLSLDAERHLLFVPTGSASPDYYGGERLGDNRYANSLVALNADTGKIVWWQQLVHHDIWDYDLASQPTLANVSKDGKSFPAVIQATKMGMVFVFNRETGEPLFPIEERPVPQSDVPGEETWPTQPFSSLPSLVRNGPLNEDDAWGLTPWDRGRCKKLIREYRSEGIYTPPSLQGSIFYPSMIGGSNWGGIAFDEERQWVVANVLEVPFVLTLAERERWQQMKDSGEFPNSSFDPQSETPYGMKREFLMSPLGIPCTAPPWGSLMVLDLTSQQIIWRKPLGSTEGQAPYAIDIGMANLGGPMLTAGHLIFIAATEDARFRAIDIESGKELWQDKLPAGGIATPMTYVRNGQQYVVIVAGGHGRSQSPMGDFVLAYALHGEGRLAPPANRTFWMVATSLFFLLSVWIMNRRRRRRKSH